MTENNKVDTNEILDDMDRLLTEEDIDGGVLLRDLLLESFHEEIEKRAIGYCKNDEEITSETFIQIKRGQRYVDEDIRRLASGIGYFGKFGQSVADWDGDMYGVSPITGDSPTTIYLSVDDTTPEPVRPKKRGERCSFCSNMKKKELKKHDSCPSCGRSLFALKSRGW